MRENPCNAWWRLILITTASSRRAPSTILWRCNKMQNSRTIPCLSFCKEKAVFQEKSVRNTLLFASVAKSCPTLCNPMVCSLPGSSVHGIFQAKILEWAAISSSRGSSWSRDWTCIFCIVGGFFTLWTNWEALNQNSIYIYWGGVVIDYKRIQEGFLQSWKYSLSWLGS